MISNESEFTNKYNYDYLPNKFYIEALDNKEKIISVIFHCIENVKVLTPIELNKEIINRMKKFIDKTNIDICEDNNNTPNNGIDICEDNNNTPNNGRDKDSKKSFDEDIKKAENKENIKFDIIDKIKNKDNTDFIL